MHFPISPFHKVVGPSLKLNDSKTAAESMDTTTDPIAMQRCADFFLENGQYDKAVKILTIARRYDEVLDLCMGHNVTLTEQMANSMVLPEEGIVNRAEAQKGLDLRVGDVLMQQGNYHLACKKYNQVRNLGSAFVFVCAEKWVLIWLDLGWRSVSGHEGVAQIWRRGEDYILCQ